jgi:hypothetical protein
VVFGNARLATGLAWLPFALLLGTEIIAWLLSGGRFGEILASLIRVAGFAVFGTMFIVRWHRFILLGETATDLFFPPGWGTFFLALLKLGLLLLLAFIILIGIAAVAPHSLTQAILIVGLSAISLVWPGCRWPFPPLQSSDRSRWSGTPGIW